MKGDPIIMENNAIMDLLFENSESSTSTVNTLESAADIAFVTMAGLKESCTKEEFDNFMKDSTALELFQVIPDASAAMEAVEKRIAKYTFSSKLSQATKASCLRLAKQNNDPNYEKYRMYRMKMFEAREKIYTKWNSKATRVAKDILRGAKNNAASMKTPVGQCNSDKLEKSIRKIEKEK